MPWQYPDNVPESAKYLKPSIQRKAVSIANAILRAGGSDSTAIAVGIKKAKEMHKKKLEKIAFIQGGAHSNMPNAWENSDALNAHGNIPLAKGLPRLKKPGLFKLAMMALKKVK